MPLSRYQIRNEYSLADPDLYRVADKDDPEALLEGVAMVGLVGVLRQLGDLAEFAAEIFHDLHEEVMATAARGHGLIVRVQQLEAEFPFIERTLLSQTNHTAFLYNSGIDWHPNARMDENVITRGDLPRFVMDSYEECRGPPRLFLLDKFDVAGAGACLKRFSDPSFFKAEATSSTVKKSDGQRERKTRRVKKRGPRWRNEDTPEIFLSSHAKLHQLFLEELIETGSNDPDRRVKLKKRQFAGSLFDQEKRKSCMEKLLDACSPEQKIVHEVCIDALPLTWTADNGCEPGLEIVEIGTVSPLKGSIHSPPDTGEMVVKPSTDTEAAEDPGLSHDSGDGEISSAIYKVKVEEEFADKEGKSEVGGEDGDDSDDVASEIDNYMDALATIESEVETDSECRRNPRYLNWKPIVVDSDASEGMRERHSLLLDSQSFGNSTASEDGYNFFKERQSSIPTSNSDADNIFFERHSTSEDVPENKTKEGTMRKFSPEADVISKYVQELENASNTSVPAHPDAKILSVDVETTRRHNSLPRPDLNEVCSNSAEAEILSKMSVSRHVNQTISSVDGKVLDAPERAERGHWPNAQWATHDMASCSSSICSESLSDPRATHDGLLQIESKKADSVSSSVGEHSKDFGMADVNRNVESVEKASSAASVGQIEVLPLSISSWLQTCTSESSFSGTRDAAEKDDHGSLENAIVGLVSSVDLPNDGSLSGSADGEMMGDSAMMGKPSAVIVPSEKDQTHDAVLEHGLTETPKQHPGNKTSDTQNSVSTTENGHNAAVNVGVNGIDAICQDVTYVHSDQPDAVETAEQLNKSKSQAVQVDATRGHDSRVTVENHPHESYLPSSSSSSSLCPDKAQEDPVSVTKDYHQNEEESASNSAQVARDCVELVQDAPVNSYNMCSTSSDGYPDFTSLNGSLAKDIQSNGNVDVLEAPLTSEGGLQFLESTSTHQLHLLEGMEENVVSLGHNLSETMIPLEKGSELRDDESQLKPLVANQQIQTPVYVYTEESYTTSYDHGQSTSFSPSDNMLSGINQATQMVENLGPPIQTPGLPVFGMLPAQPQINLDSPPLPPLPPMQWRLSRFQNSSAAIERQMVQPMTLPVSNNEIETFTRPSNGARQPGYSNGYPAQIGLVTETLPATISEVSLENSMNGIHKEDLSFDSPPTPTRSQSGIEIPEESCQPSVNILEPESLAEGHASGDDSPVMEAKTDAENGVQTEQLEDIPQVTEEAAVNSEVQFLPSSPVHYDWQAHPGLMAPEARLTWSSACDGNPINAGEYPNGTQQKKPPRPRNPLIDEVVAIDKSKLRKVERVKPSVESKSEEGESFLEQLRLRKVERVKPQVESKTREGESLLEHLPLRKVGDRVKSHQPELKTEERDSPLEQIQLRKVGERLKSEAEQKVEGTESPRVQLRKVGERAKSEVEQKPEEAESPRVQLKKVSERVKQEVEQKPEETESPRVQLRKVGQEAPPPTAPKTEERDSILEQIRNKTFSLKPAVASRPNFQGPRTNLKVAAILEKASNIRQAMAGSDEEDDDADNWSDC